MTKQLLLLVSTTIFCADLVQGFVTNHFGINRQDSQLWYSEHDSDLLYERIGKIKLEIMEEEVRRPPNSNLSPTQLVEEIMHGLLFPYDPLPDAGFRLMMLAATEKWRNEILHSVGAKDNSDLEIVVSALGEAIGRPNNQFAILVGNGEDYALDFMTEPLDYQDGTCWVECRLREKNTGKLLVMTGWDLRMKDGAWLVDSIAWQDFRDEYRPGIGREEWMRECR